jgi:hypothetical protein
MRAQSISWLIVLVQVTAFTQGFDILSHGDSDVPTLNLPWGKYKGHPFPDDDNVSRDTSARVHTKSKRPNQSTAR